MIEICDQLRSYRKSNTTEMNPFPEGQGTPVDGHRPLRPEAAVHLSLLGPPLCPHSGHLIYRTHIAHEICHVLS